MQEKQELSSIVKELRQCSKVLGKLADGLSNISKDEIPKTEIEQVEAKSDISLEDVRAVLADKSRLGFTAKIKEMLKSFGANKLSDVSPSDYDELLNLAKELKDE